MRLLSSLLLLGALALPSAARADALDAFHLTGSSVDITFTLPASPIPSFPSIYGFDVENVSLIENGRPLVAASIQFSSSSNAGALIFNGANENDFPGLDFSGPQLYAGALMTPTFQTGTYTIYNSSDETPANAFSLSISPVAVAPTPEPSSFALLGTGVLGTVGAVRRHLRR